MTNKIHIFVVLTRYHYKVVLDIIKAYNLYNNIIISTIQIPEDSFYEVVYIEPLNHSIKNLLLESIVRKRKKLLDILYSKLKEYYNIEIFIPHYFNIISNYIANYLFRRFDNVNKVRINIYPDGILSYYPYTLSFKDIFKNYIYKFASILMGMNYKVFYGNIINPFNEVFTIYSYEPKLTCSYGVEVKKIPYSIRNLPLVKENKLLILGSTHTPKNIEMLLYKFIEKEKFHKIFYKKHPAVKEDKLYRRLKKLFPSLQNITNDLFIEDIVYKYKIKTIVSVEFSTALVDLQRIYDKNLFCYANINTPRLKRYKKYFKNIMKAFNIKEI